jgi:hypothetical protein
MSSLDVSIASSVTLHVTAAFSTNTRAIRGAVGNAANRI